MVRIAVALLSLATCVAATNYTYALYDSATGNFPKTIQSWSYGDVVLKGAAPVGLPSGGAYAVSVAADWSSKLVMHGSLVFEYGDMLELNLQVYGAGAARGVTLELMKGDSNTRAGKSVALDPVPKGQWQKFTVPFSAFFNGQEPSDGQQLNGINVGVAPADSDEAGAALLVADFSLIAKVPSIDHAHVGCQTPDLGRKVSPRLFGVNFGEEKWQTSYTTNRWGGNAVTRYAWDADIQNRAADYFFEDIPNEVADVSALPFNSSSDSFIRTTLDNKALPVLTIPTIGWAPKQERPADRRCGFSVAKYGKQQQTDEWSTDCGNGIKPDGSHITGNDPTDTSRRVGPEYAVAWIDHLSEVFSEEVVTDGMLYILDNEPNYWNGMHGDVHPEPLSYDELWNYTVAYGEALLQAHPGMKLMGPDIAGFPDLFTRECGADCKAHGSTPIIEWFIKQLGDYELAKGVKLLEYLDIHCYPEGDHWNNGDAADITMRMRQTRELWDESFFAETWFTMSMGYLRRIQRMIDQHAPWLRISCTEFSYGLGHSDVTDAVLTLDALAVYVREGVDLATRWTAPVQGSITSKAYDLINNRVSIVGMGYKNLTSSHPLLGAHGFMDGSKDVVLLICRQHEGTLAATVRLPSDVTSAKYYIFDADYDIESPPQIAAAVDGVVKIDMPPISAAVVVFDSSDSSSVFV